MALPSEFANLRLWLKADSESFTDGAAVDTIHDRSGNAFDLVQSTGAAKPTFKTQQVAGLPAFRFGGDDYCESATIDLNSIVTVSAGVIYAYVRAYAARAAQGAGNGYLNDAVIGNSSASLRIYFADVSGAPVVGALGQEAGGEKLVTKPAVLTSWYLVCWRHAGGTLYLGVDDLTTSAMGSTACADLNNIGGALLRVGFGASPGYFQGDLAELCAYNVDHDEATRAQLQQYFSVKYGGGVLSDAARNNASRRLRLVSRPIPIIQALEAA